MSRGALPPASRRPLPSALCPPNPSWGAVTGDGRDERRGLRDLPTPRGVQSRPAGPRPDASSPSPNLSWVQSLAGVTVGMPERQASQPLTGCSHTCSSGNQSSQVASQPLTGAVIRSDGGAERARAELPNPHGMQSPYPVRRASRYASQPLMGQPLKGCIHAHAPALLRIPAYLLTPAGCSHHLQSPRRHREVPLPTPRGGQSRSSSRWWDYG